MTTSTPLLRLEAHLAGLRQARRPAFIAYAVAGYPDLPTSVDACLALAQAGADVLEIGPPYSDPAIDGPVIQRAVAHALDAGVRLDQVFAAVAEVAAKVEVPVVLLAYYNLLAHRGLARFATEVAASGACGVVVPDLPPEEAAPWLEAAATAGIAPIFLAAPTSSDARLARVSEVGRGFVYAQASLGVTGLRESLSAGVDALVGRIKAVSSLSICAGIGVSDPGQAARVGTFADGVVVGSALVDRLATGGIDSMGALAEELSKAIHSARVSPVE